MIVYANSLGFIESGEGPATLGEESILVDERDHRSA
jgi:hypothetical protein